MVALVCKTNVGPNDVLRCTPGLPKRSYGVYWIIKRVYMAYLYLLWIILAFQLLLSRLRLFLSPGYPYEEMLRTFHNQTSIIMCSYLPVFKSFNRTKGMNWQLTKSHYQQCTELSCITGGLIQLNHGMPHHLQYVTNAAFLASVFSDYLEAADTPGWYCGPHFYSIEVLRSFARTQVCFYHLNI